MVFDNVSFGVGFFGIDNKPDFITQIFQIAPLIPLVRPLSSVTQIRKHCHPGLVPGS